MATAPEQIQLTPQLQAEIARLADETGRPWPDVLQDALASYQPARLNAAPQESVRDALERLGLLSCVDDAPEDLSTNPAHMERFGTRDA